MNVIKVSEYVYKNTLFMEHVGIQKTIDALSYKAYNKLDVLKSEISLSLKEFGDINNIDYTDTEKTLDIINKIIIPFKTQKIQAIITICSLYLLPKHIKNLDGEYKERLINAFTSEHHRAYIIYRLYSDYIKYLFIYYSDDIIDKFINLLSSYYKDIESKDYHFGLSFIRTILSSIIKDIIEYNPYRLEL